MLPKHISIGSHRIRVDSSSRYSSRRDTISMFICLLYIGHVTVGADSPSVSYALHHYYTPPLLLGSVRMSSYLLTLAGSLAESSLVSCFLCPHRDHSILMCELPLLPAQVITVFYCFFMHVFFLPFFLSLFLR